MYVLIVMPSFARSIKCYPVVLQDRKARAERRRKHEKLPQAPAPRNNNNKKKSVRRHGPRRRNK